MRKWHEMLRNKKVICLTVGLLPLLMVLLIGTAVTAKKITASKKQQIVSSTEEAQITVAAGGESDVQVSRSTDADRYSVYILAQVIEGEAADEPYEGKVAVGAVILNRSESSQFPNSIPGVINQMGAFESVSNGQYQRPLSEESMQAAVDALNGQDPSDGALYFWNPAKSTSTWVWSRPVVRTIGNHVFAR
ncbi:cell wall hydrolase [Pelotomaculum propionicicum]|uniref:cell wall hydrolase n=1 Tax=Pelotomaculum propionicicum TaxID=258475 RepID=UPI003B7F0C2A